VATITRYQSAFCDHGDHARCQACGTNNPCICSCHQPMPAASYPCDECERSFTASRDPDGLFCTDCYGRYMVEFNR